jgi:CBS domain-containing membrane protein
MTSGRDAPTGKKGRLDLRECLALRFGDGSAAIYTFFACLATLGVSGLAALVTKEPLLFPSLGPTAFLFFDSPASPKASPRNTLIGHAVAILAGALSLAIFGLLRHPSILIEGVTLARVGAGALSVALTGAVLVLLQSSHPPSGATTLIVSLGLLTTSRQLIVLMVGVALLTLVEWAVNRAARARVSIHTGGGHR